MESPSDMKQHEMALPITLTHLLLQPGLHIPHPLRGVPHSLPQLEGGTKTRVELHMVPL